LAEISHPFHPLKGRRFVVLKERRIAGVDTLMLRDSERGSFSVAREWTSLAKPSAYEALDVRRGRLDAELLLELVALVQQLSHQSSEGLAK
jgi:Family of unknown function (DUF5372)